MKTLPFLRTGLHPSHNLFTEDRVFMPRFCIAILDCVNWAPSTKLKDGLEKALARNGNVTLAIDRVVNECESVREYVGSA